MRYLFALIALFVAAKQTPKFKKLDVAEYVDLERYLGKWYEIAAIPVVFEANCYCTTAEYSILDEKTINVVNKCRKGSKDGEITEAYGKATVVPNSNNAKLKVQFQWPFKGDYWILDVDENYQWAIVGSPNRENLWILSRQPQMEDHDFNELVDKAKEKGFDTIMLRKTDQSCGE